MPQFVNLDRDKKYRLFYDFNKNKWIIKEDKRKGEKEREKPDMKLSFN